MLNVIACLNLSDLPEKLQEFEFNTAGPGLVSHEILQFMPFLVHVTENPVP